MQKISNDIKQGSFQHAYLLYGEERYLKKQYTDRLRTAMCSEGDSMNTHFYEGANLPLGEIIDLAETLPFLAERRVFFIRNSGLFKKDGEKMAEYLSSPNETSFFVFTESEVDKRCKLYKTVQSKGYATEFAVQDENTLKKWVAGLLHKEGKQITENTLHLFLSKTGTDMENIQMELEKIICYCMDRDAVTAEDVENICTNRISNHIFDMVNAIADGQTKKALNLYYDLIALKEPPMRILFLIARQCNMLLQTKIMRQQGFDNKAIGSQIGVPPFVVGKYVAQAAKLKLQDLSAAVSQCVNTEEAVKTGKMNDMMSVELLILSVLRGEDRYLPAE
ncbi:MAG: DNA polymerase III subunit delta [Candidatus Gastranaerophilales bacterium]|nr:DNA polymerase III subunit delta [Candidatus Gastranaerophilales bacterium]